MNFDNEESLTKTSIGDIQWWYTNVRTKNGKKIRPEKAIMKAHLFKYIDNFTTK